MYVVHVPAANETVRWSSKCSWCVEVNSEMQCLLYISTPWTARAGKFVHANCIKL